MNIRDALSAIERDAARAEAQQKYEDEKDRMKDFADENWRALGHEGRPVSIVVPNSTVITDRGRIGIHRMDN